MDPNACLKEIRLLAEKMLDYYGGYNKADVQRLTELVDSLDRWIMGGGFLPNDWQASR